MFLPYIMRVIQNQRQKYVETRNLSLVSKMLKYKDFDNSLTSD